MRRLITILMLNLILFGCSQDEYIVDSDDLETQTIYEWAGTNKVKILGEEFGNHLVLIGGKSYMLKLNESQTKVLEVIE